MRKLFLMTLLWVATTSLSLTAAESDSVAEARGIIKPFFAALKGELEAAMKEGGPVNAIQTCNLKAPKIAVEHSDKSGWRVARTSLKLRNPANMPDAWETKVLEQFATRKAAGEDVMKIDYAETVTANGQKMFRYMKAIPTAEVCLNCHGSNIKPEVANKLDALYPYDTARGYNQGDIRGAFTLSKNL